MPKRTDTERLDLDAMFDLVRSGGPAMPTEYMLIETRHAPRNAIYAHPDVCAVLRAAFADYTVKHNAEAVRPRRIRPWWRRLWSKDAAMDAKEKQDADQG